MNNHYDKTKRNYQKPESYASSSYKDLDGNKDNNLAIQVRKYQTYYSIGFKTESMKDWVIPYVLPVKNFEENENEVMRHLLRYAEIKFNCRYLED